MLVSKLHVQIDTKLYYLQTANLLQKDVLQASHLKCIFTTTEVWTDEKRTGALLKLDKLEWVIKVSDSFIKKNYMY